MEMNIRIFSTLDEAQSGHGIPHRDYAQYHAYCTKRLARLRRVKQVRMHLLHNHRYVEGVSGRRHAYCARKYYQDEESKEPMVVHENLLWDIFFQAERAWAQACEMEASQKSTNSHVQRRLNKAAKWASRISELAKSLQCDETTIREAEAYAAWMKGNTCLKHENYIEAFRSYRSSRQLLLQLVTDLHKSTAESDGDVDRQRLTLSDIWMTRAESVVKPLERYCQYEARDDLDPSDLIDDNEMSSTTGSKSTGGIILHFRGEQIVLDEYKDLAIVYLKMEESLKNLNITSHHDEDSFMQLFSDLDDAMKWTRSALHRYESLPDGPAVSARRQDLQAIAAFFEYQKLSVWGQRQERRVSGLNSDADILHVYDTLLQNAQAMLNLLFSGDGDDMQDDAQILEAQAHVIRVRAFRCYYLTRLFECSNSEVEVHPKDMLAFIQYTKQLAKRAEEEIAACDMEDGDYYLAELEKLQKNIEIATCRIKAAEFLERTSGGETSKQTSRPLWMRLDEMDSGSILVDSPPLPVPIPGKPIFYDIAWQYIGGDYPSDVLEAYIKEHDEEGKTEKKTRRGFFGWFG
ncbi:signal recognition particle subunit SRP68 [Fistulifera solaris]|uniref:Signal recognition particle subunit SRP68 n=1 Tax=Fistulifera solaris TaxID=1519565 RepID=A0A1Z5KFA7_FISSO|nr:signal recognition particle subunit SRP68 [Fistulifera solaris]|eukprot:GAX24929.1 signal recognition particle subunit SRP68 [Fistulifera solaris]